MFPLTKAKGLRNLYFLDSYTQCSHLLVMQITGESLLSAVLAINKDIKIWDHAYIKLHFQELRIV